MHVNGESVHTGLKLQWILLFILLFTGKTTCQPDDCPSRKSVQSVRHSAATAEIGLVLYYTSWNKASLAARAVFAELAELHDEAAYFGAIDCWHLRCNCSGTHTQVGTGSLGVPHTWPTLIAYYGRGAVTVQYHGDWDYAGLSTFLHNLMHPFDRIHSREELRKLTAKNDALVLGLFSNTRTPQRDQRQFNRFAMAAVKWLESDPERSFRFAAAVGTSATSILSGVKSQQMPQILLITRTAITTFNATGNSAQSTRKWHVPQIVHWVQDEVRRTLPLLYGKMTPTSLAIRLKHGHVLALMATDGDLHKLVDGVLDFPSVISTNRKCESLGTHVAEKAEYLLSKLISDTISIPNERECIIESNLNERTLRDYFLINAHLNQRFEQFMYSDYLQMWLNNDGLSSTILYDLQFHRSCWNHPKYSSQELRIATAKYIKRSIDTLFTNNTGAQLHNRTLSLVILDAKKYKDYNFLNRGTLNLRTMSPSAYIIDPLKENILVMSEKFSYDAIIEFVKQYYAGYPLARHSSSSVYRFTPTSSDSIHIHEYNRDMFLQTVHRQGFNATTIVALLYSPECAFSSMLSNTLLQLSVFLNSNDITFIRLNTLTNDLPWEFAMSVTPALLVFPRGHYPESRVFPAHLKVNVQNVLGFILAQMQPIEQVKLVLESCKQAVVAARQQKCLKFAKHLVTQHIGKSLQYWQIFENERQFILNRLKEFKDLSLTIQSGSRL